VGEAVLSDVCGPATRRGTTPGAGCDIRQYGASRVELWMSGLGGFGTTSGAGSRQGFRDSHGGVLIGAGVEREGLTLGLGGGYAATMLNFSDSSSASENAGLGFVYARYAVGPLYLGVMAAYGGGTIDGTRTLPAAALAASGHRGGAFRVVQGRAAYDIPLGPFTLQPRATLAYLHAEQGGFAESGAGLLDLSYAHTATDAVQTRLAARLMRSFAAGTWAVHPWAEAGVQEQMTGLGRHVTVADGTYTAAVAGVSPKPTAGLAGAGVEAEAPGGIDLYLHYQGQFAANATGTAFTAGVGVKF
jgi:outer membrane autotransporter protein